MKPKRKVTTATLIRALTRAGDRVVRKHPVVQLRLMLEPMADQITQHAELCGCDECARFVRLRSALIRRHS